MDEEFVALLEELLPRGWQVYDPEMGVDCLLLAPCGNVLEHDGVCPCPEGHESPLRGLGLI